MMLAIPGNQSSIEVFGCVGNSLERTAMTNGSMPLGTDITEVAAATAGFGEPIHGEGAPFSGAEIRETFLADGKGIGDTLLRSHFESDIAHLRAMQIEQGMRVMRHRARALSTGQGGDKGKLPAKVREYAELPASLGSAVINGLVSAAKDGGAREQALVAWGGGSMMARRRNIGSRVFSPRDSSGQNLQ